MITRQIACLFLFTLVWHSAPLVAADTDFEARATEIFDGDSFLADAGGGQSVEVRLHGIDAPEKDQPHADRARTALTDLIHARQIRISRVDVDRFGRTVARVYRLPDELDVNAEMVKQGHAWAYRQFTREKMLYQFEREAREQRLGLWALPDEDILPPWQWRRETEELEESQ